MKKKSFKNLGLLLSVTFTALSLITSLFFTLIKVKLIK